MALLFAIENGSCHLALEKALGKWHRKKGILNVIAKWPCYLAYEDGLASWHKKKT